MKKSNSGDFLSNPFNDTKVSKKKLEEFERDNRDFVLSDKIFWIDEMNVTHGRRRKNKKIMGINGRLYTKDVKEFVRRLKEVSKEIYDINLDNGLKSGVSRELSNEILSLIKGCSEEMQLQIDKLAGEKLTK